MPISRTPLRRALWLALALALLLIPARTHAATAPAANLAPTDDAYTSSAVAARNFGRARMLVVSRRPAQRAFVRFNLGAPPARGFRATLFVYSLSTSSKGLLLRHASDTGWDERTLTGARMPRTGPRAVRSGALRARHWKAIDVTRLVNSSGVVSLALAAAGPQRVVLASREDAAHTPRLALRYGATAASNTAPPALPSVDAPPLPAPAPAPTPSSPPAGGGSTPPAQSPPPSDSTPPPSTTPPPADTPPPPPPPDPTPPPPPPPPPPPAPTPNADQPCGVATATPAWQHVVWIVMENKAASQVMGSSSAPYLNGLASKCGYASNFYAETHPSLPNYIAMTSGSPQGISDDNAPSSHPLNVPSIFSQLGGDWKSLQESMPSNCAQSSSGQYAVKHNPAAYYTNIRTACNAQDIPLGSTPDISAKFTFITPNMCSDMHDCSISQGDSWLATWVPKILNTPQYQAGTTALFITFDEDDKSANNHIATVVVSPSTATGTVDNGSYNHYSMLRTTEEMLNLPVTLGGAVGAMSMRTGFAL